MNTLNSLSNKSGAKHSGNKVRHLEKAFDIAYYGERAVVNRARVFPLGTRRVT
jgi:hypothetical protein